MRFDALVIGAGIAGSTIAYWLDRYGLKVGVLESERVAAGASGAAGAFLSPMMGKGSAVMQLVNRALVETLELYGEIAPDLLIKGGAIRFPKRDEQNERFWELAEHLEIPHERREGSIFFPEAGAVDAQLLCKRLLAGVMLFEGVKADRPVYQGGEWHAGGHSAPILVVSTGAYTSILPDNWMQLRGVWGERLAVESPVDISSNLMGAVSLSATFADRTAAIGATHRRDKHDWNVDETAAMGLLQEAKNLMPQIGGARVLDIKAGMRPASMDYLPIAGPLPHVHKIAAQFPELMRGRSVPPEQLPVYPGLYLHTGHGGRGFVTAPHTARLLAESIVRRGTLPQNVLPSRFVGRHFRRQSENGVYDWLRKSPALEGC